MKKKIQTTPKPLKSYKRIWRLCFSFPKSLESSLRQAKLFNSKFFFLYYLIFHTKLFLFDGIPQNFFLQYLIFYTELFLFDGIPHYTLNTLNNIFLHLVFPIKCHSRKLKIVVRILTNNSCAKNSTFISWNRR